MPGPAFERRTCRVCGKSKPARQWTGRVAATMPCHLCRSFRRQLADLEAKAVRVRKRIKIGKRRIQEAHEYEAEGWKLLQQVMADHQRITDLFDASKAKPSRPTTTTRSRAA